MKSSCYKLRGSVFNIRISGKIFESLYTGSFSHVAYVIMANVAHLSNVAHGLLVIILSHMYMYLFVVYEQQQIRSFSVLWLY